MIQLDGAVTASSIVQVKYAAGYRYAGKQYACFIKKGEISVSNCQSTVQDAPEINTGFFQERPK
jgi:hypothetical protein